MGRGALDRFVIDTLLASRELEPKAFRRWTLDGLARLLPFDSAIFISSRLQNAPVTINKEAHKHLYWRYSLDPNRYRVGMEKGVAASLRDGAYLDTEVFSLKERERLPLYSEMVVPQGIRSQLITNLQFRGLPVGMIYLCRHGRVGNYRPRDRERLSAVVPAIALAQRALDPPAPAVPRTVRAELALSPRERSVAELVMRGLRNPEIAQVLGVQPATVRNQLHSVFRKLSVSTRSELVARLLADE
jgi:DNA-binding CsgD family transcriptional regulator